ncbi:RNA polymerase sigma factor [Calycomorphotria hydatis]|uniref:RNA polymerase sigma factor CnrH n=1 Tax=Calycomorphotria hydatis TaxID=2528027 RepID=A0A517T3T0_9PLAN|nr:sigma-70 family RNA polymerase sigma factor [Calycomorphotria hydatis]QDT63019.1 RNA polymerase sigma factor CnrH [Calycomorphotria hydatis]
MNQERRPSSADVDATYRAHAREVWAMLYADCCDRDAAAEAVQEAFTRMQSRDMTDVRDVRAWLVRVGMNWLRDAARRRRYSAKASDQLDHEFVERPSPIEQMEREEEREQIRTALEKLRVPDRQVLVMRYALDWSSKRIAETLETTVTAVDMRISRARQRLADFLSEDDISPHPPNGKNTLQTVDTSVPSTAR